VRHGVRHAQQLKRLSPKCCGTACGTSNNKHDNPNCGTARHAAHPNIKTTILKTLRRSGVQNAPSVKTNSIIKTSILKTLRRSGVRHAPSVKTTSPTMVRHGGVRYDQQLKQWCGNSRPNNGASSCVSRRRAARPTIKPTIPTVVRHGVRHAKQLKRLSQL
jgi:hypothetical protein